MVLPMISMFSRSSPSVYHDTHKIFITAIKTGGSGDRAVFNDRTTGYAVQGDLLPLNLNAANKEDARPNRDFSLTGTRDGFDRSGSDIRIEGKSDIIIPI
jgi:hypothetical protein